jgi:glycosyltransferase involved in cell wall biosynthesis
MRQADNGEGSLGLYTEVVDPDRLVHDPLVSVVMITYNHEPYITQAIEGVLSQETDFPIELIIGEDCSTDRTREIVLDYQRHYPETIRVLLSRQNVGMHANGRRTMLAARGEYISFCEGDDWWHRRDKLQIQIPFFQADNSLAYLSGGIQSISAEGEVIISEKYDGCGQRLIPFEYQDLILLAVPLRTCTVVARADAVRRALLGDTLCSDHSQLFGDLPLWMELSQVGKMAYLRENLASFRQSPNSMTRRSDPLYGHRVLMSFIEVRYRALERYPLPGGASQTASVKATFIRRIMVSAAWVGDSLEVKNQLKRLRALGGKVGWREIACAVVAPIPLPRRALTVAWRRAICPLLERIGLDPRKSLRAEVSGGVPIDPRGPWSPDETLEVRPSARRTLRGDCAGPARP